MDALIPLAIAALMLSPVLAGIAIASLRGLRR